MPSDNPLNDPVWMNWGRLLGSLALSVLGVVILAGVIPLLLDDLSSNGWPESTMTVTNIVREHETGKVPRFNLLVDYTYNVEDQEFSAKRRLLETDLISSNLDPLMQQYAVGTQHPVFYDPSAPDDNPQLARGGAPATHLIGIAMGALMAIAGPFAAWRTWQVIALQNGDAKNKSTKRKKRRPVE